MEQLDFRVGYFLLCFSPIEKTIDYLERLEDKIKRPSWTSERQDWEAILNISGNEVFVNIKDIKACEQYLQTLV